MADHRLRVGRDGPDRLADSSAVIPSSAISANYGPSSRKWKSMGRLQ
jgi:hypothetical protein